MELIKPSFEIIEQQSGLEGILKHIERIGRVCYKSEENITDTSYIRFVEMLKNRKHGAMLEHGTVYLYGNDYEHPELLTFLRKLRHNKYTVCKTVPWNNTELNNHYITTNYRVISENSWGELLQKYFCEPTEYHEKRYSVKFICCRGVSHEFVRNRGSKGNAFAQESTRYCNYNKDKFNNEITFIYPCWLPEELCKSYEYGELLTQSDDVTKEYCKILKTPEDWDAFQCFITALSIAESEYFGLLENGWLPQQAREVLPNALKTELVMTCFESDWKHFLSLRADKAAHPQAQELIYPLKKEFKNRNWL